MIHSTKQVAKMLNVSTSRVRHLAKLYKIGFKFANVWLFEDKDIALLKKKPWRNTHP